MCELCISYSESSGWNGYVTKCNNKLCVSLFGSVSAEKTTRTARDCLKKIKEIFQNFSKEYGISFLKERQIWGLEESEEKTKDGKAIHKFTLIDTMFVIKCSLEGIIRQLNQE